MANKKSYEWFINELNERNITHMVIMGDFINMGTKILVRCKQCGTEWYAHPQHLLQGRKCIKCALKNRNCSNNKRKTTDEFVSEMMSVNPNITITGEYTTAKTKIACKCKMCQHEWSATPSNLLTGYGCPKCGNRRCKEKQLKRDEIFKNEMTIVNPSVEVVGEYTGDKNNIKCRCKLCGNYWSAMPINLLRGTTCPIHKSSHGERNISEWLDNHKISYVTQKKFDDLRGIGGRTLPYDFYIPEQNMLIEFQGNFHDKSDRLQSDDDYKIRIQHDIAKRKYAHDNGYNYYEIWYYDNLKDKLIEIFNMTNPVTTTAV